MTIRPPPCEERNGQTAEEEQGAREETDRWKVGLPVCGVGRRNQECLPMASLTALRMEYKCTGGGSGRTDRLDIERGRPADRVAGRQMDC